VGLEGQLKLKASKVLLVGVGGLGSPTALYLAAAGVGTIGIVDSDRVDHSNLHRQIIHGVADVGRPKLDSAEESIQAINPNVKVIKHEMMLTSENALEIVRDYDLVIDGTDNFPTRYLVNDACVLLNKLNMYGSIYQFDGQASVFGSPGGPCYRCLYPEPPPPGMVPNCAEGGVLGVLPGLIGTIQATEAVKAILGIGELLVGRLLMYDALAMSFRTLKIKRDPACPICGENPTISKLIDYDQFCGLPPKDSTPMLIPEITVTDLRELQQSHIPFTLVDVREPNENALNHIEGSILIPLGQLPDRLGELDKSGKIVVHCQSGMRSSKATAILLNDGFQDVSNLKGGIAEWLRTSE
jgi:adenylyltransferase/sulfurtransferase